MRAAAVALLAALAVSAHSAPSAVAPEASPIRSGLGVPTPRLHITWHMNTACPDWPRGSVWGCAGWPNADGTVDVYIDAPQEIRNDVAWHETGHVFDYGNMTAASRASWLRINRRHGPWWGGGPGTDSPGEQFAESYRMCALHHGPMNYDYYPAPRQLRATCRLIRSRAE